MDTDDPWAAYTRLQNMLQSPWISDRTWAVEETANVVLEELARGRELSAIQVENLISNRAAKHRQHRQHDRADAARHFVDFHADAARRFVDQGPSPLAGIELQSRLKRCFPRDQSVLVAIGSGLTTREIALAWAKPEGTIKTWVRRARAQFTA